MAPNCCDQFAWLADGPTYPAAGESGRVEAKFLGGRACGSLASLLPACCLSPQGLSAWLPGCGPLLTRGLWRDGPPFSLFFGRGVASKRGASQRRRGAKGEGRPEPLSAKGCAVKSQFGQMLSNLREKRSVCFESMTHKPRLSSSSSPTGRVAPTLGGMVRSSDLSLLAWGSTTLPKRRRPSSTLAETVLRPAT
jgi:hypothetical protein